MYDDYTIYRMQNLETLMSKDQSSIEYLYNLDRQEALDAFKHLRLEDFPMLTDSDDEFVLRSKLYAVMARCSNPSDEEFSKQLQEALLRSAKRQKDEQAVYVAKTLRIMENDALTLNEREWLHNLAKKERVRYLDLLEKHYGSNDLFAEPAIKRAIKRMRGKVAKVLYPDNTEEEQAVFAEQVGSAINKCLFTATPEEEAFQIFNDPFMGSFLYFCERWNLYSGTHLTNKKAEKVVDGIFLDFI